MIIGLVKQKIISQATVLGKSNIFLIQESKLIFVDYSIASSFWNNEKVGWSFVESKGQLGVLITI